MSADDGRHHLILILKAMKKYFLVQDESNIYGVFEYTNNTDADRLIMQMICETLDADDVGLSKGFRIEEYQHKPMRINASTYDESGDATGDYFLFIEQIGVYAKPDETTIEQKIKNHVGERLYPIGFKFSHRPGKAPAIEKTILNYSATFNLAGNIVNFLYVLSYDFCGQRMTEEVVQTTIDRATNNAWKNLKSKK